MKITCPYCENLFNDTLEKCPSCGAPNAGVVRKSGGQPITIEELKDWYASKGLPPYETTRFFIGEDYRKPRAFGIYKDEKTGNFVVYKNKDSGQRAVRYEGTDEAYAVNELYQRLKQEIIQQKRANAGAGSRDQGRSSSKGRGTSKFIGRAVSPGCLLGLAIPVLFMLIGLVAMLFQNAPKDGYYRYDQTLYYHYDYIEPDNGSDWFWYDEARGEWTGPKQKTAVPKALEKKRNAKAYYLSKALSAGWPEGEFTDSMVYQDIAGGKYSDSGYYRHGDTTYYHLSSDLYSDWYYYDSTRNDWYESDYYDIPYELQHSESSEDFYYTPTWDSTTQITDFTDTEIYESYMTELAKEESRRESRWDDDDDDYSWDSGDSWDSGSTDWDSDW